MPNVAHVVEVQDVVRLTTPKTKTPVTHKPMIHDPDLLPNPRRQKCVPEHGRTATTSPWWTAPGAGKSGGEKTTQTQSPTPPPSPLCCHSAIAYVSASACQQVWSESQRPQLPYAVLRGFRFLFPHHPQHRHEGNVDEAEVVAPHAELELTEGFQEGHGLDVA